MNDDNDAPLTLALRPHSRGERGQDMVWSSCTPARWWVYMAACFAPAGPVMETSLLVKVDSLMDSEKVTSAWSRPASWRVVGEWLVIFSVEAEMTNWPV